MRVESFEEQNLGLHSVAPRGYSTLSGAFLGDSQETSAVSGINLELITYNVYPYTISSILRISSLGDFISL